MQSAVQPPHWISKERRKKRLFFPTKDCICTLANDDPYRSFVYPMMSWGLEQGARWTTHCDLYLLSIWKRKKIILKGQPLQIYFEIRFYRSFSNFFITAKMQYCYDKQLDYSGPFKGHFKVASKTLAFHFWTQSKSYLYVSLSTKLVV